MCLGWWVGAYVVASDRVTLVPSCTTADVFVWGPDHKPTHVYYCNQTHMFVLVLACPHLVLASNSNNTHIPTPPTGTPLRVGAGQPAG